MSNKKTIHRIVTIIIATIWFANGLLCKVLDIVPRHQSIVARILGRMYAQPLTIAIGIAEVLMAIWILSRVKSRLNAIVQILIIAMMNCIEFIFAADLLLWGRLNVVFAFLLTIFIYYNEFRANKEVAVY